MTLLVDVDGVVVSGAAGGGRWSDRLQDQFDFDAAALREHFFAKYWAAIVIGQKDTVPYLQIALNAMGSTATAKQVQDFWLSTDAALNDDVLNWVSDRRSAGHRAMLATNQAHDRATYLMETLGLDRHFDGIYYSAAIGAAKPNSAFFDAIRLAEGKPADQLFLIDDTKANIDAARSAGWDALHFQTAADLSQVALT